MAVEGATEKAAKVMAEAAIAVAGAEVTDVVAFPDGKDAGTEATSLLDDAGGSSTENPNIRAFNESDAAADDPVDAAVDGMPAKRSTPEDVKASERRSVDVDVDPAPRNDAAYPPAFSDVPDVVGNAHEPEVEIGVSLLSFPLLPKILSLS